MQAWSPQRPERATEGTEQKHCERGNDEHKKKARERDDSRAANRLILPLDDQQTQVQREQALLERWREIGERGKRAHRQYAYVEKRSSLVWRAPRERPGREEWTTSPQKCKILLLGGSMWAVPPDTRVSTEGWICPETPYISIRCARLKDQGWCKYGCNMGSKTSYPKWVCHFHAKGVCRYANRCLDVHERNGRPDERSWEGPADRY